MWWPSMRRLKKLPSAKAPKLAQFATGAVLMITSMLASTTAAPAQKLTPGIAVHAEKEAYYGDLHLFSANTFTGYPMGVHISPDGAYRFARGEAVTIDGAKITRRSPP